MVEELGFSLHKPLLTVHAKLKDCDALDLLSDESLAVATQVVTPDPGKSRSQIQREIAMDQIFFMIWVNCGILLMENMI